MNRSDSKLSGVALDVEIAARTTVPVLISANPENAMGVATAIAGTNDHDPHGSLVVVPAANIEELRSVTDAEQTRGKRFNTVVVRDIDSIDKAQQNVLVDMLAARSQEPAPRRWRLITTTSSPLYDLLVAGGFEPRLYYYLNAIHIIT
jgi:sigma-54-interacting transcriptional regulator